MSTIVTRAGKGSALTHNEVDANFNNLNTDKLQSGNTAAALTITTATFGAGTVSAPAITTSGDTNTGIYFPAADTAAVSTGGSERMRIDSSGNLGLGVTPSAWYTSFGTRAIQIGASAALVGVDVSASDRRTYLTNNSFLNSVGVSIYINSSAATQYLQVNGAHQWFNAASGTAGNAITFTQAMTLDASGNLGIGTTSPSQILNLSRASGDVIAKIVRTSPAGAFFQGVETGSSPSVIGRFGHDNSLTPLFCGTTSNHALGFYTNNTERARITSVGNVKIGGTADRATTEGTNQLVIFNGTAPVGTLTNGVSFYSAAGEARVMDAAGNSTLLSPHDQATNEWIFHSKHTPSGKVLRIDVEKMLRFINDHFGLDMIQEFTEE